jgi:hypothetical protein
VGKYDEDTGVYRFKLEIQIEGYKAATGFAKLVSKYGKVKLTRPESVRGTIALAHRTVADLLDVEECSSMPLMYKAFHRVGGAYGYKQFTRIVKTLGVLGIFQLERVHDGTTNVTKVTKLKEYLGE